VRERACFPDQLVFQAESQRLKLDLGSDLEKLSELRFEDDTSTTKKATTPDAVVLAPRKRSLFNSYLSCVCVFFVFSRIL
jgi:hypothetical protein